MIVFHANEHRRTNILVYAEGSHQWLGDGWYFWQDLEFAEAWGPARICKSRPQPAHYDIYEVELELQASSEELIDTVFNEEDYRGFVKVLEYWAAKYESIFGAKPKLSEFNDFIQDHKIWGDVKAIRFQDLPANDRLNYLKVKGFFYKKRIQLVVFDFDLVKSYRIIDTRKCR